ncbi:MAG: pyridoxal phosphate-dependent aminotransferase [Candidatus Heimdallarchaeota archaeon]|nr:pyridoxal phosphate-dependent aminotransferase [Candidatus Heimdallarchaeota archaeon]
MRILEPNRLKQVAPVKWHDRIPEGGISLGVADVDYEGPEGITEFIKNRLTDDFSFYQHQRGLPDTLNNIMDFLSTINIQAEAHNVQVIPGTMMGIYAGMKYASRREGKVIYAGPLYEPIHRHGKDTGNDIEFVPIEYEGGLNHEKMTTACDSNTKMIAINNPSNPNGYVYTKSDLKLIRDLCVDNDLVLFADELYQPLVFDRSKHKHISPITMDGLEERTIALYGFSKAYGLAGYRSGFMYIGDMVSEEVHNIITAQMVSISPISSIVCDFALTTPQSRTWVEEFRQLMEDRTAFATRKFHDAGYDCVLPDSCFFIYPDIGSDDVKFSETLLDKRGIQVVPGSVFGPTGVNHLRINCATSEELIDTALDIVIEEADIAKNN